jgi:hypothetical protein
MQITQNVEQANRNHRWGQGALMVVAGIALLRFVVLMMGASRYGYFGDELYFLAAGEHIAWGYVDFPPLIAFVAWLLRHTTGVSLVAVHTVGALVGAGTVVITAMITRELGARTYGIALACTAFMAAGVYWVLNHLFTMNMFEPLLWMSLAYILLRVINTGDQRWWIWFGVVAGIGMLNKYSIAIFGFALIVGLSLTPERKAFTQRWIWIAGAIALLIWLPNAIWQTQRDWPFAQFIHNVHMSGRDVNHSAVGYFGSQIMMLIPTTFPLWFGGLMWLLWNSRYRLFGMAYFVAFAVMVVDKGKDYYLSPVYPLLFAAGAVPFENWASRLSAGKVAKAAAILILAVPTALLLPVGVPILPIESYVRYQSKLPFKLPVTERAHALAILPHQYAWAFGWDEMVEKVAEAWNSLPPEERAKTAIIGENFGEAGAIDLLGEKIGLPHAFSGHQNNWYWGPPSFEPDTYIIVGSDVEGERKHFQDVQVFAELNNPYSAVWERGPVLICRHRTFSSIKDVWPKMKNWK